MSKVLHVEGSLHYDDDDESSEEEPENNSSNDAPLVFDSDGSDEEELEIFHDIKEEGVQPTRTTKVSVVRYITPCLFTSHMLYMLYIHTQTSIVTPPKSTKEDTPPKKTEEVTRRNV
jgi:hypothetical protein